MCLIHTVLMHIKIKRSDYVCDTVNQFINMIESKSLTVINKTALKPILNQHLVK